MIEEAGLTIIFYHDGNILEAAASAIAGKKSRFWLELGMKWNGYFFSKSNHVLNVPFVLGISPSLPATLLVAVLKATASALKALSALW